MEWLIWSILGGILSAAIDKGLILAGLIIGFLYGLILRSRRQTREAAEQHRDLRLSRLEIEVAALRATLAGNATSGGPAAEADTAAIPEAVAEDQGTLFERIRGTPPDRHSAEAADAAASVPAPSPQLADSAPAPPPADLADSGPALGVEAAQAAAPAEGSLPAAALDDLYARARGWLFGGNTLVRLGMLVLFFGFAFLAKFAADHALLPVELRLTAVAAGGLALLATGWRLRRGRRSYALILQGGGIAVLYLTVFTALRLFQLLPTGLAFALMVSFVVATALLALLQDAMGLAIAATAGGFAAPILASTGGGSHVALFSYYALLDAGVLFLAWHRAWRPLNLAAFLFTFVIGLAWGARYYQPEFLATTTPFVALFWAMFVAAAVFYARHQTPQLKHYVDGSLVFGVPVCGFGMLAGLLHGTPFALAYAALIAAAVYVLLAKALWRRPAFGLLGESVLALGVAFLTMAIPLALDGRWTAAAWALEGAALVWVGSRQQRRLATASGLLLQLAAGLSFLGAAGLHHGAEALPFLNGAWLGCVLIALAGLLSGAHCARPRAFWPPLAYAQGAMLAWGLLWWLGGSLSELDFWLADALPAASLALFALSAVAARIASERSGWSALALAGLLPLAGMLLNVLQNVGLHQPPLAAWGWAAWPLACAAHLWTLSRIDEAEKPSARWQHVWHAAGAWLLTAVLSWELSDRVADWTPIGSAWSKAAAAFLPILLLFLSPRIARATRWPLAAWQNAYQRDALAPVAVWLALWCLLANPLSDGSAAPLPYLPLLNPLDLGIVGGLLALLSWRRGLGEAFARLRGADHMLPALGGIAFLAANGALLRALHHALDLPYRLPALLQSDTVQAALALFWSLLALATMLLASRRRWRPVWMAGAALLGLTVLKLFLVDMAHSDTVARIVAFLGAGALLLVVGYFSPLPPRQGETQ